MPTLPTLKGEEDGFVYVIQAQQSGRVKIGTADNPNARTAALQIGSPDRLILLCFVTGGRQREALLHAELKADRLHGEWFEWTPRVAAVVRGLIRESAPWA